MHAPLSVHVFNLGGGGREEPARDKQRIERAEVSFDGGGVSDEGSGEGAFC